MKKIVLPLAFLIVTLLTIKAYSGNCSASNGQAGPCGAGGVCSCNNVAMCYSCCVDATGNSCSVSNCVCIPPVCNPIPGVCTGPTPACGATGPGVNSCGDPCSISGPTCPIIPPIIPPIVPPGPVSCPASCTAAGFTNSACSFPACPNATYTDLGFGICSVGETCCCNNAPPAPVVGPCPAGTICGSVKSQEDSTLLTGMILNLKDSSGHVINTTKTNALGNYSFSVPTNNPYYVSVALNRNQNASPPFSSLTQTFSTNFAVRGVPARVSFTGLPKGTFILLTKTVYNSNRAPSINATTTQDYYSKVVGTGAVATLDIPGGSPYFITCWEPSGTNFNVSRSTLLAASDVIPQTNVIGACQ